MAVAPQAQARDSITLTELNWTGATVITLSCPR